MNDITQTVRPKQLLAAPVKLDQAFADPDDILRLIRAASPYKTLAAAHKNHGDKTGGWFRNFWALGGKVVLEGAESHFQNPNFISAAKTSFQAEVIQPVAMMTNFNLPAPGAPYHLDLPFFRGAQNREVPSWMLAPMGYCGLFHDWAIPVASAITWFYEGVGGEFEYWPEGLDAPSLIEAPPYFNTAVLADNEYMFHRVGAIGTIQEQANHDDISHDALLVLTDDNHWTVQDSANNSVDKQYAFADVRLSILWKAYCFKNGAEADAYHNKTHDLTPKMVVDILLQDLNLTSKQINYRRGEEQALFDSPEWKQVLIETYTPKGAGSY